MRASFRRGRTESPEPTNCGLLAGVPVLAALVLSASAVGQEITPGAPGQAELLGNDRQSIGFTGYEKDQATGLYYAGARFYDPLIGRFVTRDPVRGDPRNPVTLNPYVYANANPTFFVDPTGKYGEAGHYYTTYFVALKAGFPDADARALAFYSQAPDEVSATDAIQVAKRATYSISVPPWFGLAPAYANLLSPQDDFHALTHGDANVERDQTVSAIRKANGDLPATGVLIHRLADTFSHREMGPDGERDMSVEGRLYGPQSEMLSVGSSFGHAWAGTSPDTIQRRPDLFLRYAHELAEVLAERRGITSREEREKFADSIANALSGVAAVPTRYDHNGQVVERSNEELEEISVRRVRALIEDMNFARSEDGLPDIDLGYRPEDNSPSLLSIYDTRATTEKLYADYVRAVGDPGEATLTTSPGKIEDAFSRARQLIRQQKEGSRTTTATEGNDPTRGAEFHRQ